MTIDKAIEIGLLTELSTPPVEIRDDGEYNLMYPHENITAVHLPESLLKTGQFNGVNVYVNGIRCDSDPYGRLYDEEDYIILNKEYMKDATWAKMKIIFEKEKHGTRFLTVEKLHKFFEGSDLMFKGMSFKETVKYYDFIKGANSYGNEWLASAYILNQSSTIQNLTSVKTPLGYKELFSLYGKEELYNNNSNLIEIMGEVKASNPDKSFFIVQGQLMMKDEDTTLHGDFEYYSNGGVARC